LLGNGYPQLGFYNYGTGEIESKSATSASTDGKSNLTITASKQSGTWLTLVYGDKARSRSNMAKLRPEFSSLLVNTTGLLCGCSVPIINFQMD
jgi:hypothetical protein